MQMNKKPTPQCYGNTNIIRIAINHTSITHTETKERLVSNKSEKIHQQETVSLHDIQTNTERHHSFTLLLYTFTVFRCFGPSDSNVVC